MKAVTIYFYGEGESAIAEKLAAAQRTVQQIAMTRDASAFTGEVEKCNRVVILDGVTPAKRSLIEKSFSGLIHPARGSTKWDGGPLNTETFYDQIIPDQKAEINAPRRATAVEIVDARTPARQPEDVANGIDVEKTIEVLPGSEIMNGPKANPEEVSSKFVETNQANIEGGPERLDLPPPARQKKARAKRKDAGKPRQRTARAIA